MLTVLTIVIGTMSGELGRVGTVYGSPAQCEAARRSMAVQGFHDVWGRKASYDANCAVMPPQFQH
jgi:hypothetical protein